MATLQMLDEGTFSTLRQGLLRHNFLACLRGTRACGQARGVTPPQDGNPATVFCCAEGKEVPQRQSLDCVDFH